MVTTFKFRRPGFTIAEAMIALAVMIGVAALVGEHAVGSVAERQRTEARMEALEIANNVLELARATPWEQLDAKWAEARMLPEDAARRWNNARMTVRVETEAEMDRVKRVTVEIAWERRERSGWAPVKLQALFAARDVEAKP